MSATLLDRPVAERDLAEDLAEPSAAIVALGLSVGWSARNWLIAGSDYVIVLALEDAREKMRSLAHICAYEHGRVAAGGRSGRRISMDVDALVADWVECLVALATAHDHEARSRADHMTDDLLRPLLTAPIAELRRFALALTKQLRADQRVPFLIWSGFEKVIEPLVRISPEGEVLELRQTLANEVAELVEKDLDRAQLVKAIADALAWRNPEKLTEIKAGLVAGDKPKLRGRESCLFLEVGKSLVVL